MIVITLPDAADDVGNLIHHHIAAEVAADCEPAGYAVLIEANAIEGVTASLQLGSSTILLGSAVIDFRTSSAAPRTAG